MAFLSRSRLPHDLAACDGLLLAHRHAGMTIGLKVINRKRAIMVKMCVQRSHQRRTLSHDPHTCVASSRESTLVAFGTLEPTLQIHIVSRHISQPAPDKQPWLKTVHYCGKMLVHRVSTGLPVLPQRVKQHRSRFPRGFVTGLESAVDGLEVLDV
jgi:hypothetical protein